MNVKITTAAAALIVAATFGTANAQYRPPHTGGYTGPTQITPQPFGGGYTITTPGQPSTQVTPQPFGGGYTFTTPGQPSRQLTPQPFGGGYTFQ